MAQNCVKSIVLSFKKNATCILILVFKPEEKYFKKIKVKIDNFSLLELWLKIATSNMPENSTSWFFLIEVG